MLWILIGEERSNVQNLDGTAVGQASYRPAELPFPLIGCIWRLGYESRDQAVVERVGRSNVLNLDGNAVE